MTDQTNIHEERNPLGGENANVPTEQERGIPGENAGTVDGQTPAAVGGYRTELLLQVFNAQFEAINKRSEERFSQMAAQIAELSQARTPLRVRNIIDDLNTDGDPAGTMRSTAVGSANAPASDLSRDAEFEAMKAQLREITSKIHQATSAAPEIERVIQETQKTPFTPRVAGTLVKHMEKLKIKVYEGNTDPWHFLTSFGICMNRYQFKSAEERDAVQCQLFVESLGGVALDWFSRLEANSIDNYKELTTAFVKHFSVFIGQNTKNSELWQIAQGPSESLHDFIQRFKTIVANCTISDEAALLCLQKGARIKTSFRSAITQNPPQTLEDALHRANTYIAEEEEEAAYEQSYSTKQPERSKVTTNEPQSGYGRGYENRKKFYANAIQQPTKQWNNKWVRGEEDQDESLFCEFHNRRGHSTEECRHLREYLLGQYRKGPISVDDLRRLNASKNSGQTSIDDLRRSNMPRPNNAQLENAITKDPLTPPTLPALPPPPPNPPALPEQQKRNRDDRAQENHAPKARKRVNMIMGAIEACSYSVRAIKEYSRQAASAPKAPQDPPKGTPLVFTEADTIGLHKPHNDALVVEQLLDDVEVSRILVDTGSSVNIIFKEALDQLDLSSDRIEPFINPLTGFDGERCMTVGMVNIPIYLGGVAKIIQFLILYKPAIYNANLGTPWLHAMKAVASTYHQCLKFPTPDGVYTLRGNQAVARSCYINECRLHSANQACVISSLGPTDKLVIQQTKPKQESIVQVCIDELRPERQVGIGAELDPIIREPLIHFLKQHSSTFAWSVEDMPGIDPQIACHELNIDPTYKPIKQKRQKLRPEKAQAVNDEVERLLKAGSITEVKYPDWLANPVVVKKKNGKWRICVDFTDLNKACPKDSLSLPHIDRLVEATAGNELLSFMDAFFGYNQILMHPQDREKTSFITDRGIYYYKVMPFGLKNAGATYQRLVNRMFASQLGRTMEVYIDDMLVKSLVDSDHVGHLRTCFDILDQYGMKLNPTKCTFGITSGEFLGYIVTWHGIEANPKQIAVILELPSPTTKREVQRFTGLRRSLCRAEEILVYAAILSKPETGETLYLYIEILEFAVSSVLVREDRGEQKPIFYISKSLDGLEYRYPTLEKFAFAVVISAKKLRPYFQSFSIVVLTDYPLRTFLHSPSQSGRLAKWAIELSECNIEYRGRTATKSQVLADFLVKLPPELVKANPVIQPWILHADGSSSHKGSGVGIRLKSPEGEVFEQSFHLGFPASNNEAEYEALIAGLRLAKGIGAEHVHAYCDSQLVANQFHGEYEAKNDRMDAYLKILKDVASEFSTFELTKIPRDENATADALAALATNSDPDLRRTIPIAAIERSSIEPAPNCNIITRRRDYEAQPNLAPPLTRKTKPREVVTDLNTNFDEQDDTGSDLEDKSEGQHIPIDIEAEGEDEPEDWTLEIVGYIGDGTVPTDKWAARRLKARAARYVVIKGTLLKWDASGVLLTCVRGNDIMEVMQKVHEGEGGNHSGARSLAFKIKKVGYYWPTMLSDCEKYTAHCEKCQRHSPMINLPTELLMTSTARYPFMRWAMDIIGPFRRSTTQKQYVLVVTDYFTKWVEAEAYPEIHGIDVKKFVWKFIICRHGVPYEIVTDNGTQFTSIIFTDFCAKWKIRLSFSTPRYPQGNGQAEATNKTIIDGLKKRLDTAKGTWADELDGVLWSHRTTPGRSTGQSPFFLAYGTEAMCPAERNVPSIRRTMFTQQPDANNDMMLDTIDLVEEHRERALLRIQNYQQLAARYYNKKVKGRHFEDGDLVLRKVYQNTEEKNAGKLGANWEGPYQVMKVVKPGVYQLMKLDGTPIQRSWNSMHLKRYYY
ncbi:uncharacterized protein LOC112089172 [Eutrema salsugineum]|uniref:uncharacterized protein LOC112089172 n=1 Tax=Eutrema salsugineum TaxID=72664 RepID=UPI000CED7C1E|nr:uncharacterized protein LOC112089172 [Eutrema salsugineum]